MLKWILTLIILGGSLMATAVERYDEILNFWLGDTEDRAWPSDKAKLWYSKDDKLDREVRERFGSLLAAAKRGGLSSWKEDPLSRLALIILTDQFSRNIHRGSSSAFAYDEIALKNALEGIEKGEDLMLTPAERQFFYMPLMHAEDRSVQKLSLERFQNLVETSPKELHKMLSQTLHYAHLHAKIIFRFDRYPHRNAILGRIATKEEIEFLSEPNSSF
jgi:uncharacterized protein (DUF924 family)